MTDAQFINESLQLKEKVIGLKNTMERLRKFFEYAMREICSKNDAEAKKLLSRYWHQHNQDFRVFHNLSENEIYNIIKRRGTVSNAISKLLEMNWKLTHLVDQMQKWHDKGKIVFTALELCRSVQNETRRTAAQDVQTRIEEMKHAKDEMIRIFNLVRQLAVFIGVPFIREYISLYANIFVKLGNLCDKVADYAMRIVEETENALGPKSGWSQVFRDKNSLRNLTFEELYKLNNHRD